MGMRFFIILPLVLMLTALSGRNASAVTANRFALVIGNAKYPDSDTPPEDAVSEARALAKALRHDGFDVVVGKNLTKAAMRSALDQFYGKIKSHSAALIFFSGYGIQSNRQSYMIPVNAQIWTEADVRRDGFSIDAMLNEMNIRGAKVKIAILNASRRNPYERRFRPVASGLAPVIAPPNSLVMYSAAPGTVVDDVTAGRGLFVKELIKEMSKPGLTGEDVFTRTRQDVARLSNSEQTPWFSSSLGQEFYFKRREQLPLNASVDEGGVRKPAAKAKPAPAVVDVQSEVRRDYRHAEQIGTHRAWSDFLVNHPSGHYADLARIQLAKLEQPPLPPKTQEPKKSPPVANGPANNASPSVSATDKDLDTLNRRLQDNPNDLSARYKRGMIYARNGDFARAIGDFDDVIRAKPHDFRALNDRCWARAMLDELQTALKDCDEALRLRPRFAEALDSRGFVKLKIGLPRNAIVDYDASLRINPVQASSLYGRGIAKLRSGNIAGGNSDIAQAKSIDPHIADEFAKYGIR